VPTLCSARKPSLIRHTIRVLALCAVVWLLWTVLRSWQLLANTRQIALQSEQFPRDYFVGNPKSPAFTYCILGDSTAVGCGARRLEYTYTHSVALVLTSLGYRVHVINLAVNGATMRDVRQHQLSQLPSLRPNLISISIGANDATHFTSSEDYSQELNLVMKQLNASTATHILFANTPDMYLAPALPLPLSIATQRRAQRQNEILNRALAGSSSRIELINLYDFGKLDYHMDKNLYASDLFHPSSKGYGVWTKIYVSVVEDF
jgi:lysophospholipase L1-like esterase